jgi:hypothetical protein
MTELQLLIKKELENNVDARVVDIARKLNVSPSTVGVTRQFLLFGKRKVECDYKKNVFQKTKILAECPTCHIEHVTEWKGKITERKPKIYCKQHKGNRKCSEYYSGATRVPAKSTSHTILD